MKRIKLLVILIISLGSTMGTAFAVTTVFNGDILIPNGNTYQIGGYAISISRTDPTGTTTGNDLNLRGFNGISFRTGGTSSFGTGNEIMRVGPGGVEKLNMANGKSITFGDNGISASRTDSSGTTTGNFLNLRGYDGIVMRTGGTSAFGSGNEKFRMSGTGIQNMVMAPDGKITSSGDICIGTCP